MSHSLPVLWLGHTDNRLVINWNKNACLGKSPIYNVAAILISSIVSAWTNLWTIWFLLLALLARVVCNCYGPTLIGFWRWDRIAWYFRCLSYWLSHTLTANRVTVSILNRGLIVTVIFKRQPLGHWSKHIASRSFRLGAHPLHHVYCLTCLVFDRLAHAC